MSTGTENYDHTARSASTQSHCMSQWYRTLGSHSKECLHSVTLYVTLVQNIIVTRPGVPALCHTVCHTGTEHYGHTARSASTLSHCMSHWYRTLWSHSQDYQHSITLHVTLVQNIKVTQPGVPALYHTACHTGTEHYGHTARITSTQSHCMSHWYRTLR